jgi:hypothetical protein
MTFVLPFSDYCVALNRHKDIKEQQIDQKKTIEQYDLMVRVRINAKRMKDANDNRLETLESKYSTLLHDMEELTLKWEEHKELEKDTFDIRHNELR